MTDQERLEIFKKIEEAYEYIEKARQLLEDLAIRLGEMP